MGALNGHKKVIAVMAVIGGVFSIATSTLAFYSGWTRNVEARVIDRQMVNAHDLTLKALVPKVDTCHEVNAVQQSRLDGVEREVAKMANTVDQFGGLMQLYLQSQMREGKIPR